MTEEKHEKKIFVDEDWKSQVEAEKESLKAREEASKKLDSPPEEAKDRRDDVQTPPASFAFLVTTFATQVLAALGQIADPTEGKPVVRLGVARHFIDTLAILEEKTKGNLSSEEEHMLAGTIHHLRMTFVSVQSDTEKAPRK